MEILCPKGTRRYEGVEQGPQLIKACRGGARLLGDLILRDEDGRSNESGTEQPSRP